MRVKRAGGSHHGGSESGSALALVPAGFLVLIILAAIAVDSAVALLGQRQLGDALAAAANDAAGAAISNSTFYGTGRVALDPAAAARTVCVSLAAQHPNLRDLSVQIAVAGRPSHYGRRPAWKRCSDELCPDCTAAR